MNITAITKNTITTRTIRAMYGQSIGKSAALNCANRSVDMMVPFLSGEW
jgi:hypothetical protein